MAACRLTRAKWRKGHKIAKQRLKWTSAMLTTITCGNAFNSSQTTNKTNLSPLLSSSPSQMSSIISVLILMGQNTDPGTSVISPKDNQTPTFPFVDIESVLENDEPWWCPTPGVEIFKDVFNLSLITVLSLIPSLL